MTAEANWPMGRTGARSQRMLEYCQWWRSRFELPPRANCPWLAPEPFGAAVAVPKVESWNASGCALMNGKGFDEKGGSEHCWSLRPSPLSKSLIGCRRN